MWGGQGQEERDFQDATKVYWFIGNPPIGYPPHFR